MSAPQAPNDELTCGAASQRAESAAGEEVRGEHRQRRELEPGREQVEVRITGRGGSGRGAVRGDFVRNGDRLAASGEADGEQSRRVAKPVTDELPEAKPKLRLIRAGRELSHTSPLLTHRGESRDELLKGVAVGVHQQSAPDRPEVHGVVTRFWRRLRVLLRLVQSFGMRGFRKPRAGLRHTDRSGHSSERAESGGVPHETLGLHIAVQTERPVQQIRALGTDTQRSALERRRGAGRPGTERVTTQERREFVGGRERVGGFSKLPISERDRRLLRLQERRASASRRHGINGPMSIDEVRAARGRRGEDCV
jgi:hypothetical protein